MTDEEAVEQFEAFVLAQKPAEKPWAPVTDYSYEGRKAAEGEHPALIWRYLISCDDADVLDYGCGPDGHLVRLLQEFRTVHDPYSEVRIRGYDPQANMSELALMQAEPRFRIYDLVICREVLEHCTVREVRRIVAKLCELSQGLVYVTTRYAQAPAHFLSFDSSDNLDPTHISMGTKAFLRMLFVLEGFKSRPDLEAKMDWKNLGRCLVMERVA